MNESLKRIAHLLYNSAYVSLQRTQAINLLIPKKLNSKKVLHGHIRLEQETNPLLDKAIVAQLNEHGIANKPYHINTESFKKYLSSVSYPPDYYASETGGEEFIEKALEHFVSLQLIEQNPASILIDIGAGNSPFARIAKEHFGIINSFSEDKQFPAGINARKVGGTASLLPFEEESVDTLTLHCSLEHFEGREDVEFFREAQRVLKVGGKCVCLPFYLSSQYTVHLDPVYNLLRLHRADISADTTAVPRYCDSRQFFSRHYDVHTFRERILIPLDRLDSEVLVVQNYKDINKECYLRFILVLTKVKSNTLK